MTSGCENQQGLHIRSETEGCWCPKCLFLLRGPCTDLVAHKLIHPKLAGVAVKKHIWGKTELISFRVRARGAGHFSAGMELQVGVKYELSIKIANTICSALVIP